MKLWNWSVWAALHLEMISLIESETIKLLQTNGLFFPVYYAASLLTSSLSVVYNFHINYVANINIITTSPNLGHTGPSKLMYVPKQCVFRYS